MALLLVIVLVIAGVTAYSIIERRLNHRTCPECGFTASIDAPGDDCQRCNPLLDQEWQELQRHEQLFSKPVSKRVLGDWPKIVFFLVPLAIVVTAAGLLSAERSRSDADRAIQLVRESNSRKDNVSVEQYLYATVYHRRDQGEPISIEGWRVEHSPSSASIKVEFVYADADGHHTAKWEASLKEGRVTPRNETASSISWH